MSATTRAAIVALPKAEVHVHLEGCFETGDLLVLAHEVGEPLLRRPASLLRTTDDADRRALLAWSCGLVHTGEQAARAAYAYAERAAASGVRYADVTVTPARWPHWHDRLPSLIDALDAGWRAAERDGYSRVGLCFALQPEQTALEAAELVDLLTDLDHPRVVGFGLDGDAHAIAGAGHRFAEAFRLAGAAGLRRSVPAGAVNGAAGVRDALDLLHADRLDDAARAVEDQGLVRELARCGVPLAICPSSDLERGRFEDREHHPLDRLRRLGVRVSVATDHPALLGIDLAEEYRRCAETFHWGADELRQVAASSIDACFTDAHTKSRLLVELSRWDPRRCAA